MFDELVELRSGAFRGARAATFAGAVAIAVALGILGVALCVGWGRGVAFAFGGDLPATSISASGGALPTTLASSSGGDLSATSASAAQLRAAADGGVLTAQSTAGKKVRNGWVKTKGKKRYYVSGKPLTGVQQIKGKWYYFNKKGVMQTGLKKIKGWKYYFRKNGSMMTNAFKTIRGKKYFFTSNGMMGNIGYERGYLIAHDGVCWKVDRRATGDRDADARRVASLIARCCGEKGSQTDVEYVGRAAYYVSNFCAMARYTTEGADYQTPYGVFISGEFSCAGSTRALGLVLDYLGYAWEHVNPGQWTHQWCRLTLDGQVGYADAALLPVGTVGYGMTSPVAQ